MSLRRKIGFVLLTAAASFGASATAMADTYPVIVRGTIVGDDGAPLPFSVSVEKVCSDAQGNAPGPLANKKGEWSWRIEIDPLAARACFFRSTHPGYTSSTIEASSINFASHDTTITLPPIVLSNRASDPETISASDSKIPARADGPYKKAMKALDAPDFEEAVRQLKAAVAAAPKFEEGWHALGVVEGHLEQFADARDAFTHAIDADPKALRSYVMLARVCIRTKDWDCVTKTADNLIKADTKKTFPEIYLHRAVARYELKDLPGAEENVQEALRLDPRHKKPRAEYVLGRILEAKGDTAGAREHMSRYLELDQKAPDAELVRGHLANLGKPAGQTVEPELEPI